MAQPLPDPSDSIDDARCVVCGYSLAGLTPPAPCPECAAPFTGRRLTLHGIPAARGVWSSWRITAMILLAIAMVVLPQIMLGVWIGLGSGLAALALAGILGLAAVILIITSPKAASGPAAICFCSGALAVIPRGAPRDSGALPDPVSRPPVLRFAGDEQIRIDPISDVWARLTVRRGGHTLFRAGFRCPRASRDMVIEALRRTIADAAGPPAGPPTDAPSAAPPSAAPPAADPVAGPPRDPPVEPPPPGGYASGR